MCTQIHKYGSASYVFVSYPFQLQLDIKEVKVTMHCDSAFKIAVETQLEVSVHLYIARYNQVVGNFRPRVQF